MSFSEFKIPKAENASKNKVDLPVINTDAKASSQIIILLDNTREAAILKIKSMLLVVAKTFEGNTLPAWADIPTGIVDLVLGFALDGVLGTYIGVLADHAAGTDKTMTQLPVDMNDDDVDAVHQYFEYLKPILGSIDNFSTARLVNMRNALAMSFVFCVAAQPRKESSTKWTQSRETLIKSHFGAIVGNTGAPGNFTLRGAIETSTAVAQRKMYLPKCYCIALLLGVAELSAKTEMDFLEPLKDIGNYLANNSRSAFVICADHLERGEDPVMYTSTFKSERAIIADYVRAITINPSYKYAYLYNTSILDFASVKVKRLLSYILGYTSVSDADSTILSYNGAKDEKMFEIGKMSALELLVLKASEKTWDEKVALAERLFVVMDIMYTKEIQFSEAYKFYQEANNFKF